MNNYLKGFDIIIPVYNEGKYIIQLIEYLLKSSSNIVKIYICYDFDEDTSLKEIKKSKYSNDNNIILVKNLLTGPCEAVKTGILSSNSRAIIVYPADDFYNGILLDKMYKYFLQGYDVICPSRFIKGGVIKNCPFLKFFIVKIVSFSLYYLTKIKIKDPTNGFRMFSKKLLDDVTINSQEGFAYSIELLIKARKRKLNIIELPSVWIERIERKSSFKIFKWSPAYLKWFFLAFLI